MKIIYSLWWLSTSFVFTLSYVNLWSICILVAASACINVIYAKHQTVQQLLLAFFFIISVLLSILTYLVIGFFFLPFTKDNIILASAIVLVSFLNYAICILNYNSKWIFLLWFIGGIYIFVSLITFVPYLM